MSQTPRRLRFGLAALCSMLAATPAHPSSPPGRTGGADRAQTGACERDTVVVGACDQNGPGYDRGDGEGQWDFVRTFQLGVDVHSEGPHGWVGLTPATDGLHDWAPFDDFKTTICGTLARFGTFQPDQEQEILRILPEVPEHDWNIILIPTKKSVFEERFKLAQKLMERGQLNDLENCSGDPCFEAEVTPHKDLLRANISNGWLSAIPPGETVCTYGPWVGDGGHGYRPEIHPAERIWWLDQEGRLKLFFVQDASERFWTRGQYQWGVGSEPKAWRPWAAPGMEGEFRIAFELRAPQHQIRFQVDQLLAANVNSIPLPANGDRRSATERCFSLRKGSDELGYVEVGLGVAPSSNRPRPDASKVVLGVTACQRKNGDIQGYLRLRDRIGYRYQHGEGFDAFAVATTFGGDARPEPPSSTCAPRPDLAGKQTSQRPREALRASVRITATEGPYTIGTKNEERKRQLSDLLTAAASDLAEAAPPCQSFPSNGEAPRDLVLRATRRFRLAARPHYDGPRGDRLERAIKKGKATEMRDWLLAFHDGPPLQVPTRVAWEITVRDFTAHDRGEQVVACGRGTRLLEGDECEVQLHLPEGHVGRLLATATLLDEHDQPLRDEDGHPVQSKIRLASHFIEARNKTAIAAILSWVSGVCSPASLSLARDAEPGPATPDGGRGALDFAKAAGPDSWLVRSTRPADCGDLEPFRAGYHARMLRHGLELASSDGRVTLDELSQFLLMADAFSRPPDLAKQRPTRLKLK